jgi:hypothetical protein
MSKKKKAFRITLIILNILALVGFGFASVFYFLKYNNLKNTNLTSDQRIAKYEKEIGKTYAIPAGEKPTLYDVTQADCIKKDGPNMDFFKDSQNGDVLLLYGTAKIGILYRPSAKKIIKVGPAAVTQQVAVQLIGAKADRDSAADIIKEAFSSTLNVASQVDAKAPLTSTVVVDVSGKNAAVAATLATELKGRVGDVPEGQDQPAEGAGIAVYVAPVSLTP